MKKSFKKILVPFVGPLVRIMHLRIFGRRVFINKYTRKVPFVNKFVKLVQTTIISKQTAKEREFEYRKWQEHHYPDQNTLQTQVKEQIKFQDRPLISILMPTYNTEAKFLREAIQSVIDQTYDNWQLCVADDASTNQEVRLIIEEFASQDKRINYVFRKDNGHICRASNSALELARGEYVALLDHDDLLWPNALYEIVRTINDYPKTRFLYSDEDKIDQHSKIHSAPFLKPDWSFEFLRSINYITHFAVAETKLVKSIGGFRTGYEGAQDWDLFLRISRETEQIHHVPKVLYSWRKTESSTALSPSTKKYAYINQKKALQDDIRSRNLEADIKWQIPLSMWRVDYKLKTKPLVSIIIPTKDQYGIVRQCLKSIEQKTTYKNFELVIVDTGSTDKQVWELYDEVKKTIPNTSVVEYKKAFNFSSACNLGAAKSKGEYLVFLNNDTEVISPTWLEDMIGYGAQKDIGAVGCKLYYPDGRLQHAGIILGVGGQNGTTGIAGHFFPGFADEPQQDPAQQSYIGGTRNFAAVTAACLMVARDKFDKVDGFDPKFRIAFNDVDFCLKLMKNGWRNVYLPHVKLYHHESISIGQPGSKQRDVGEFKKEIDMMYNKWKVLIKDDPFDHPAFRRDIASARLRIK